MMPSSPAPDALLPAVRERWSPRAFTDTPVAPEDLRLLLEAARWAPSGMNNQPWRFLVAPKSNTEDFATLFACLVPANQRWAQNAAVLIAAVAETAWERKGVMVPNPVALYELGLAVGQMGAQATALGLRLHQMGGFIADELRRRAGLPEHVVPAAMIAVGYQGDPDSLPPDLAERERAPRGRRELADIAFGARYGESLKD